MQKIRRQIFQSPTGNIDSGFLWLFLVNGKATDHCFFVYLDVAVLTTDAGQYGTSVNRGSQKWGELTGWLGSYAGAGHLISSLDLSGPVSDYARWLDMDQGVARTSWTQNNISMLRCVLWR